MCVNNENKEKMFEKLSKPVIQFKGSVKCKSWDSAKQAEKDGGFNSASIRDVCVGRRKTHKGFRWKYKNEEDIFTQKCGNLGIKKPITCIYENGKEEVFDSKKEASLKLELKESTIQNIVLGKTKQKKEFILIYTNGTN